MRISKSFMLLSLIASTYLYAESTKLGDVTVTANKIEENIIDVPQSITVITGEQLQEKRIYSVADIIKEIPNMNSYSEGEGTSYSFRGLLASAHTFTNPIVIYIDGVSYYDKLDINPSFADVERIEVLRGPQGTLYGKDAIGGVINIITKAPKNEWSGTVGAEYGSDNYMRGSLNASGAIIENKLYAGINGTFSSDDGWLTNTHPGNRKNANEEKDRKTSGFLLYKPTDELSARLTLTDNNSKEYGAGISIPTTPNFDVNNVERPKNVAFEVPSLRENSVKSEALNIGYEFENMKLEAVTTHKNIHSEYQSDADGIVDNVTLGAFGLANFSDLKIETYTQEIKLVSKNQTIKWVSGVFFDKEERNQPLQGRGLFNVDGEADSQTYAIFGQVIIPFKDSFELTLGGRYQKIEKEVNSVTTFHPFLPTVPYIDENTWNTFLPKVALLYNVNDDISAYASVAQGYMPGGFNLAPFTSLSTDNAFEPQESTSYEIGLKMQGDNYIFNVALFRMNIEDLHVFVNHPTFGISVGNAPKAHSQGIELDGTYLLSDTLSISGALGLIEAEFDDYTVGGKILDGERTSYVPEYTANLSISYEGESGIYGRLDFNAQGSVSYFDSTGGTGRIIETDGGVFSNLRAGYKFNDWDIYGYVSNITDEELITSSALTGTRESVSFIDPQSFGIGVRYNF